MENITNTNNLNSAENLNPIVVRDDNSMSALFTNPETAENVYKSLLTQGYPQESITLVMSEDTHNAYFPNNDSTKTKDLGNKALEGLGIGAAIGGSVGAIAAAIAALGTSLVIPGLGLIVAGPLAASFAGAGAGAAAGGFLGTIVGSETPNDQAKLFEEGLKKGGVVISIKTNSKEDLEKLHKHWNSLQGK